MTLADYMRCKPQFSLGGMYWDAVPITSPQGLRLTVLRLDPVVRQVVELFAGGGAIYHGYRWAHGASCCCAHRIGSSSCSSSRRKA
jgi:hypothetical protein